MTYRRILLVEDDLDDDLQFQEALKIVAPQAICTVARDGAEALKRLRSFSPDIIFSDVNMPMVNGLELLSEVTQQPNPIRIVIMSTANDISQQAIHLGANDFFVKPDRFSTLCQKLRQLLF
jgi:CheY-like chemotaxis protein